MDLQTSLETLKKLARGVNPINEEAFPKDSPYNHPDIIRALYLVVEQLSSSTKLKKSLDSRRDSNRAKGLPSNTGLPWSDVSRTTLAQEFEKGTTVPELAQRFERSRTAIAAELKRQGLISEQQIVALGLPLPHFGGRV